MSENSSSSDFLYIILTIIAAIIGLVKKSSSKQKRIPDRQVEEEEQSMEREDLYFPQNKIVADYSDSIGNEYFSKYNFVLEAEQEKDEEEFEIPEEQANKKIEPAETDESIDFDARTAFIYSEILNRKYK